jgi:hypothetical protein
MSAAQFKLMANVISETANAELYGVDILEAEAARDPKTYLYTLEHVRRSARILGVAAQVMNHLADNPNASLGMDLSKLEGLI